MSLSKSIFQDKCAEVLLSFAPGSAYSTLPWLRREGLPASLWAAARSTLHTSSLLLDPLCQPWTPQILLSSRSPSSDHKE